MFKIGDKVVCINLDRIQLTDIGYDHAITGLVLHSVYNVVFCTMEQIFIKEQPSRSYNIDRFILFTEHRKLKIEKLLKNGKST